MGEHLLCKQGVAGSTPVISTRTPIKAMRTVATAVARLFDNRIR